MSDYQITQLVIGDKAVTMTLACGITLTEPYRRHIPLEKAAPAQRHGLEDQETV